MTYQLSPWDRAEVLRDRGVEFTHAAARGWEARFAPIMATCLIRGETNVAWAIGQSALHRVIDIKVDEP